jgi:hypothetical protein
VHADLLNTALELLCPNAEILPSAIAKRRSISTTYYAMFHHISGTCTLLLAQGRCKALSRAQTQVYRSIDHRDVVAACHIARRPDLDFPKPISEYARVFLNMHTLRGRADYDPASSGDFNLIQAFNKIADVEDAIRGFDGVQEDDKRAFAVLIAIKKPRNTQT